MLLLIPLPLVINLLQRPSPRAPSSNLEPETNVQAFALTLTSLPVLAQTPAAAQVGPVGVEPHRKYKQLPTALEKP